MKVGYVIASYRTGTLASRAANTIYAHAGERAIVEDDPDGTGYSATLNRGIRQLPADVDLVCCLNADVEMLASDEPVRELFDQDVELGIVGPRQITPDPKAIVPRSLIAHGGLVPRMDGGTEWDLDLHHRYWLAPWATASEETAGTFEVPAVPGSVFYMRRAALRALGGWPVWTRFYYEDTFLSYLARLYGWRVLYTGSVTWTHFGQQGSPLDDEARVDRMKVARERFCFECGRVGIPLRFDEEIS